MRYEILHIGTYVSYTYVCMHVEERVSSDVIYVGNLIHEIYIYIILICTLGLINKSKLLPQSLRINLTSK